MAERTVKELDPRSLRALAHPLRTRLLAALRAEGPATATMLAQRLGESSGATSYHLRQLAGAGFIEDDPGRGNGRERWWRSAQRGTSWKTSAFLDDPVDREAAQFLERQQLQAHVRWLEQWQAEKTTADRAWLDAASSSDYRLRLTPDTLRRLAAELHEVLERYWDAEDDSDDAERCQILLHAFPQPRMPL